MHRRILLFSLIVCVGTLTISCSEESTPTSASDNTSSAEDAVEDTTSQPDVRLSYPPYCFSLNVPFLTQVPPGDWSRTNNCGQAVCVMLGGYFNNGIVNSSIIDAENDWLGCGNQKPNGCRTGAGTLKNLLWGFHRLNSTVYYGRSADDVVNEVKNGRPTIVGVMINNGRLVSSGGRAHWALCVGYDGNIVLHDPGTNNGRFIRYSIGDFERSWATQNKIYIPVWK